GRTYVAGGDQDPFEVETREEHLPAIAERADQVLPGDDCVLDHDLVGPKSVSCERRYAAHLQPRGGGVDEDQADALAALRTRSRAAIHRDGRIRLCCTGAPHL